jgi:hypothetical protein
MDRTAFVGYKPANDPQPDTPQAQFDHGPYVFDAERFNTEIVQALAESIGVTFVRGKDCVDNGSTTTVCNFMTPTDRIEVGDVMIWGDGSRQWRKVITVKDTVSFSDSDLTGGSPGSNNYNTILSTIRGVVIAKPLTTTPITKNEIVLGNFAAGLNGANIRRVQAAVTTIDEAIEAIEDDFYASEGLSGQHADNGVHSDGFLTNLMLDKDDVLKTQGFRNILKNAFFRKWTAGTSSPPDHYVAVGVGAADITRQGGTSGYPYFCRIDVGISELGYGMKQSLANSLCGLNEAPYLTMRGWIRRISGGTALRLKLEGSVAGTTDITISDIWTRFDLTSTVDAAGICPASVVASWLCNSANATIFELAGWEVLYGDVAIIEQEDDHSQHAEMYEAVSFYVATPATAGNKAKWTPQEDIVIRRIDAFVITPESGGAGAYVRYTLTDGTSPIYAEISNEASQGNWTGNQKYASGVELTFSTIIGFGANQALASIQIQYQKF